MRGQLIKTMVTKVHGVEVKIRSSSATLTHHLLMAVNWNVDRIQFGKGKVIPVQAVKDNRVARG
jgi:hypothetical protein